MTAPPAGPSAHRLVRVGVVAGGVLLLAVLFGLPAVRHGLLEAGRVLLSHDPAQTHAWVSQFGGAGPLVLIMAFVVQAVLPLIPALVLTLVALLAYGPMLGFLIVYVGTVLGAVAGYSLGRGVGDPVIRALAGQRGRDRAHAFAAQQGVRGVILIRLMPILSSDVMNLVAGATRMPFLPFLAATAAGALPVTLLISVLAHGTRGDPARLGLWLAALSVGVGLLAAGRWWLGRRAARRRMLTVQPLGTQAEELG
ncbi:TVP38/TMEM64 family protein [Deinococcus ruber]|uniref:TVP38/TMEM64 family protein n=1 Tax=Deinococcus ruber TaxID=1848197 RepID=UPI00166C4DFB|nr:TVP38/TMEM64 family protein [Deinococcus ruber]